ncbi:hypothetical protein [Hymenobacter coccineus]|uniref:Glycerophosphoryl diester phosphodiesterase membrane domain-containing protein n=1 Tax=Hymenobacter coccineus TaxID=1908235 RepID=A0A1G1T233_9BACT|nr:hypothetical protein [Hymenobacter coccineus]OGX84932.1 hypothetical protein BEN49_11200 [Hymenobacter coccineus]
MANTYSQESDFRQERDFGQKISATFEFIGVHFRPLGRVLLYIALPAALVQGVLSGLLQTQLLARVQTAATGGGAAWQRQSALYGTLFSSPTYYLNTVVSQIFTTLLILSVYGYLLHCLTGTAGPGRPASVADVWAVVKREFLRTFLSIWGLTIVIMLGLLVFVLPGMYLMVALSLFFIVRLVEGTGFRATLSRCLFLTRGKWWSTFGVLFIMVLLLYVLLAAAGSVATLLAGGLTLIVHSVRTPLFTVTITAITTLFTLLVYPPLLLVLAFQYFNLVELKESRSLHALVGQLGQAPAAAGLQPYGPGDEGEY